MANFTGKWELVSTDGVPAYMVAIGVSEEFREKGKALEQVGKVREDITIDGTTWKTVIHAGGEESYTTTVNLGGDIETTTMDGRTVKVKNTIAGDKITCQESGPYEATTVYEIVDGNLNVTGTSGSATFKRVYKKV